MSIKGPEFWMRAWWCRDTPVQKFCGLTDWLNSVSVTGTAALSSPGERGERKQQLHKEKSSIFYYWLLDKFYLYCRVQPHAYLFDAFLVLDEELNARDVDVEPWSLRRALHWSVYTAIVLAAHTHANGTHSQTAVSSEVSQKCTSL